jgi:hypothetical protein
MAARKPNETIAMTAVTEAVNSIGSSFRIGGGIAPLLHHIDVSPFALHNLSPVQCEPNNAVE